MENLDTKDKVIRTLIGSSFLVAMLTLPLSAESIAALIFASFYPLMTALVAIDPVYSVATSLAKVFTKTTEVSTVEKLEKL